MLLRLISVITLGACEPRIAGQLKLDSGREEARRPESAWFAHATDRMESQ